MLMWLNWSVVIINGVLGGKKNLVWDLKLKIEDAIYGNYEGKRILYLCCIYLMEQVFATCSGILIICEPYKLMGLVCVYFILFITHNYTYFLHQNGDFKSWISVKSMCI